MFSLYDAKTQNTVDLMSVAELQSLTVQQVCSLETNGSSDFKEGWQEGSRLALQEESTDHLQYDEATCCERFLHRFMRSNPNCTLDYLNGVWVGYVLFG